MHTILAFISKRYYFEAYPSKSHAVRLPVEAFYIDKTPVTGKAYGDYLKASGYWPADDYNFLVFKIYII